MTTADMITFLESEDIDWPVQEKLNSSLSSDREERAY
jgi:hypothetical protein